MTLFKLDIAYHLSIVEYADSQISKQIWKMLSNFNRSIMSLKKLYLTDKELGDYHSTIKSHQIIIQTLSNRDLDATLKELAWHIKNSIQIYKDSLFLDLLISCISYYVYSKTILILAVISKRVNRI